MRLRIEHALPLLAVLAWVTPTLAFDTLSAGAPKAACTADKALAGSSMPGRRIFCMHGFIDGALAADQRVTMNVERVLSAEESFSERAFRTRLGPRMDPFGRPVFAGFGVPVPLALAELVGIVVGEIVQATDMAEPAREPVCRALRKHYPCPVNG